MKLALAASLALAVPVWGATPSEVLQKVQAHMTSATQVNSKPHINTMTRAKNVNVYQVTSGVFAYTSSMAVDTDGSDPDPDPDHQKETAFTDDSGKSLGAHHVPYYVLGDYCYDKTSPCPHFYYKEHGIKGLQFALVFHKGKAIGAVFGDTQGDSKTPTSDNDSRELGEQSVHSAQLLGIPSSGTSGGVDGGVTTVIFSGSTWVMNGKTSTDLNNNAQALVQKALDMLAGKLSTAVETTVTGACTADDLAKMSKLPTDTSDASFGAKANDCGHKAYHILSGFSHQDFNTCMAQEVGISSACSECYAAAGDYGVQNCKLKCISEWCKSDCLQCTAAAQQTAATCSGRQNPQGKPCSSEEEEIQV